MRINTTRQIFLISLVGLLSACSSTQNSAPVSERRISGTTPPKAAVEDRTTYTVKKGDTLYRIALDFGQSYSEIVAWNNLANPNDIKVGQVLRVAPPDSPVARSGGAQTGAIASSSVVESRPLGAPASTTASAGATNKTSPRGEKRPYSDATLAEMQKPESAPAAAPAASSTASTATTAAKPATPADTAAPVALATDDDSVSWIWPADGKVVGTFDDGRKGLDIAGKSGQAVLAAGAGKVMYAGSGIRGYGNLVIVKHTSNLLSAYAHNKAILVKEGQNVNKGQKIAEMGDSDSDSVKLHFEIRQQGKPVDPSKFLPSR
ncbi:peptidoglycan DD-metalloendopeptidase family protein [Herminiimonas glaciei]|uniref:Peptidoglycan DD-metalloendopeptidase family protein n=1 Tax=Herminiimonas glaciei TaxID=523788 RepID=A0ABW2I7R8_9BURK